MRGHLSCCYFCLAVCGYATACVSQPCCQFKNKSTARFPTVEREGPAHDRKQRVALPCKLCGAFLTVATDISSSPFAGHTVNSEENKYHLGWVFMSIADRCGWKVDWLLQHMYCKCKVYY